MFGLSVCQKALTISCWNIPFCFINSVSKEGEFNPNIWLRFSIRFKFQKYLKIFSADKRLDEDLTAIPICWEVC